MIIYVAGEVPRPDTTAAGLKELFGLTDKPSADSLTKIYREIEAAASNKLAFSGPGIELKMPYPDAKVDALGPKEFVDYLREEISKSDGVLTVFSHPGIAVGFEASLASELRKPQIILVPSSLRMPRYLAALPNVVKIHTLQEIKMSDALAELTAAVQKESEGVAYA
jgi:hypothetical protein